MSGQLFAIQVDDAHFKVSCKRDVFHPQNEDVPMKKKCPSRPYNKQTLSSMSYKVQKIRHDLEFLYRGERAYAEATALKGLDDFLVAVSSLLESTEHADDDDNFPSVSLQ